MYVDASGHCCGIGGAVPFNTLVIIVGTGFLLFSMVSVIVFLRYVPHTNVFQIFKIFLFGDGGGGCRPVYFKVYLLGIIIFVRIVYFGAVKYFFTGIFGVTVPHLTALSIVLCAFGEFILFELGGVAFFLVISDCTFTSFISLMQRSCTFVMHGCFRAWAPMYYYSFGSLISVPVAELNYMPGGLNNTRVIRSIHLSNPRRAGIYPRPKIAFDFTRKNYFGTHKKLFNPNETFSRNPSVFQDWIKSRHTYDSLSPKLALFPKGFDHCSDIGHLMWTNDATMMLNKVFVVLFLDPNLHTSMADYGWVKNNTRDLSDLNPGRISPTDYKILPEIFDRIRRAGDHFHVHGSDLKLYEDLINIAAGYGGAGNESKFFSMMNKKVAQVPFVQLEAADIFRCLFGSRVCYPIDSSLEILLSSYMADLKFFKLFGWGDDPRWVNELELVGFDEFIKFNFNIVNSIKDKINVGCLDAIVEFPNNKLHVGLDFKDRGNLMIHSSGCQIVGNFKDTHGVKGAFHVSDILGSNVKNSYRISRILGQKFGEICCIRGISGYDLAFINIGISLGPTDVDYVKDAPGFSIVAENSEALLVGIFESDNIMRMVNDGEPLVSEGGQRTKLGIYNRNFNEFQSGVNEACDRVNAVEFRRLFLARKSNKDFGSILLGAFVET